MPPPQDESAHPREQVPAAVSPPPPPAGEDNAAAPDGGSRPPPPSSDAEDKWATARIAPEGDSDSESDADDDEQHGFGPGMRDDGRPRIIDGDWSAFKEMIERRSDDDLRDKFGGLQGIAGMFKSDPQRGIDQSTWQARQDQFGENLLSKKEPATFLEFFVDELRDEIVQILCAAAVLSIIFGLTLPDPNTGQVSLNDGWIEGTAIIISVLIVTMTGSINNYQKAKRFEEMEREQAVKDVQVIREGKEVSIKSDAVVPGDILVVETGMELSVDGVFISGSDVKVNESALTGEPDLIEKSEEKAWFISGTSVEEGNGMILVVAVGMGSFQGTLKSSLDEEAAETPLQEHLSALADSIGTFGLAGSILLVVALSIKEGILISQGTHSASVISFLNFILIAITLIAVAIPEGLHLAVTISLAFGMKAMMKENCMVRILASCETMGAATAICSDKTGTLTTNEMTVVQGLIMDDEFVIDGYGLAPRSGGKVQVVTRSGDGASMSLGAMRSPVENIDKMTFALSINSTARESVINDKPCWIGNKTEQGLLKFVKVSGRDYVALRDSVAANNVRQYPFSSEKKRMTTIVREKDGTLTAYFKGASEAILAACDRCMDENAVAVNLTDALKEKYDAIILDMASQGNRTIGVAYATLEGVSDFPEAEPDVRAVFMGVLGIQDPIKEAVPDAVLKSQSAGVTVRMVTGDNINTAVAIAKKCHIYNDNGHDVALTGPDFREMFKTNRAKLVEILPRIRVLARSSPQDKHILVGLLQDELGDVVGVTGDGTNDAPALKLADVGFAMQSGTDIAKGASDMVLLDDNFATVVTAIRWGRAVNDNIRKFLQFQLAINAAGVGLTIVGSLASPTSKEPFTPVQLLWLNLIMDTLAAIALATELPEDSSLERPPVFKQAPLISANMRAFIGFHGVYQFTMIMLILLLGNNWFKTYEGHNCDVMYGKVLTLANASINGTNQTHLVNVSIDDPRLTACRTACKHQGGTFDSSDQTCQQGNTHSTLIFNIFIWFQIFNVMNARKIHGEFNPFEGSITRSRNMFLVFGIIFVMQVIAVEVFGAFMSTTALSARHWGISVGLGATVWVVGFFQRLIKAKNYVPTDEERREARRVEKEHEQQKQKEEEAAEKAAKAERKKARREAREAAIARGEPVPPRKTKAAAVESGH